MVYDPSLGFTTGGGWFYWPGTDDRTNFGYTMKYNRKATNVQGSLLMIRHYREGYSETIYRVKSNALYGLAIGSVSNLEQYGWASFSGKSVYFEPGMAQPEGNHVFNVYVEDRNEPGRGFDKFWIHVEHGISMNTPAPANAIEIEGGNIFVPHTPASTRK